MKKFLLIALFVAVVLGVLFLGSKYGMRAGDTATDSAKTGTGGSVSSSAGHGMADGMALRASFVCDEGSTFVVEFPTRESMNLVIDGKTISIFPRVVSASGQKYGNDKWEYFFKGEDVTVTDKTSKRVNICKPPLDAENAPVNFGD